MRICAHPHPALWPSSSVFRESSSECDIDCLLVRKFITLCIDAVIFPALKKLTWNRKLRWISGSFILEHKLTTLQLAGSAFQHRSTADLHFLNGTLQHFHWPPWVAWGLIFQLGTLCLVWEFLMGFKSTFTHYVFLCGWNNIRQKQFANNLLYSCGFSVTHLCNPPPHYDYLLQHGPLKDSTCPAMGPVWSEECCAGCMLLFQLARGGTHLIPSFPCGWELNLSLQPPTAQELRGAGMEV